MMNPSILDDPIWHSLNSYHRHLAIRRNLSVRYHPDIAMAAAVPENAAAGFDDLAHMVEADETVSLVSESLPKELTGWQVLQVIHVPQMVCKDLKPSPLVDAIRLTAEDVPEMLNLVALTQPGPLLPRSIKMGIYLGLRRDNQLVAMAGQRAHMSGNCEISTVCVHSDYRGRGFAAGLTTMLARSILKSGEIPFLRVLATNAAAMRLYMKLGFRQRKEIPVIAIKKLA